MIFGEIRHLDTGSGILISSDRLTPAFVPARRSLGERPCLQLPILKFPRRSSTPHA
jgi:hypothetical protein